MLEFVTTGWLKRNLLSVTKLNFKTIFYTDTTYILDIKLYGISAIYNNLINT